MTSAEEIRAIWTRYREASCEAQREEALEAFAIFWDEACEALEEAVAEMLRAQREGER